LLRPEVASPPATNFIEAFLGKKSSVNKIVERVHNLTKVVSQALEDGVVDGLVLAFREYDVDVVLE
jgi:hypothetical protein